MGLRERFARWLLKGVRLDELKIGGNTMTLSPSGVGDVLRWSGTQAAVAAGDIGMNTSSGRPSFFVGGSTVTPTTARVAASGNFSVPASIGNHLVHTFIRNAGERVWAAIFMIDAAVTQWTAGEVATVGITYFFRTTSTTNELSLWVYNSATSAREIDWTIYAEAP